MDSVVNYCTFHNTFYFVLFLLISAANPYDRFVKGIRPGHQTDFDIDDSDLHDMEFCRGVVVASAIFGTDLSVHLLMHFLLNLLAMICNKYIPGQALLI